MKKLIPVLVALFFIGIIGWWMISTGFFGDGSSSEWANLNEYFNVNDEEHAAIVMQDGISEYQAIIVDDIIYLNYDFIYSELNYKLYYDANEGLLLYTNSEGTVSHSIGTSVYTANDEKKNFNYNISFIKDGCLYVAIDYVQEFTNMEYKSYSNPARVCITNQWGEVEYRFSTDEGYIRESDSKTSDIVAEYKEGEKLFSIDIGSKWSKVMTDDGIIGYAKNSTLSAMVTDEISRDFEEPERNSMRKDYMISMAWHQVSGVAGNDTLSFAISQAKDVNVISPTWFSLKNAKGGLTSYASEEYVTKCHNMNVEVWALINDFSYDSNGNYYVSSVLAKTSTRKKLIKNLINEVVDKSIDGINVDFECISYDNKDNYLQFLRELSVECQKNEIVLSIDNYIPTDYSEYYNRTEQGELADYVIVMCYDEHNSNSQEAGSVASLPFVEEALEKTINEVGDASKVIMAIPFYTRVWKEAPEEYAQDGDTIIQDAANGNYALSSQAVSMDVAKEAYKSQGATPKWDKELGQYYVTYEKDNSVYKIWLEETDSIEEKMKLISRYEVAGAAYWKLGMENQEVWNVIDSYIDWE
ncbi:MAG: glycosyl hydrolase family 18 protein [Eubacterium sp.]